MVAPMPKLRNVVHDGFSGDRAGLSRHFHRAQGRQEQAA
jgi:hypothetical protein